MNMTSNLYLLASKKDDCAGLNQYQCFALRSTKSIQTTAVFSMISLYIAGVDNNHKLPVKDSTVCIYKNITDLRIHILLGQKF